MKKFLSLLQPNQIIKALDYCLPIFSVISALALTIGLSIALKFSPADYQQSDAVRIMYIHVPSAWLSLMIYTIMAVLSGLCLIYRNPLFDLMAKAIAPIGASFTFATLVTGSIWGKPMWGAWWVWDARLTSVLILFFFYLSYIAFARMLDDREINAKSTSVLALIGFINIPIIKFSVTFWNSLHQPASIIRFDRLHVHPSMMKPLLIMAVACLFLFLAIACLRIKSKLLASKIMRLQNYN